MGKGSAGQSCRRKPEGVGGSWGGGQGGSWGQGPRHTPLRGRRPLPVEARGCPTQRGLCHGQVCSPAFRGEGERMLLPGWGGGRTQSPEGRGGGQGHPVGKQPGRRRAASPAPQPGQGEARGPARPEELEESRGSSSASPGSERRRPSCTRPTGGDSIHRRLETERSRAGGERERKWLFIRRLVCYCSRPHKSASLCSGVGGGGEGENGGGGGGGREARPRSLLAFFFSLPERNNNLKLS